MAKAIDFSGKKIGRLTAVEISGSDNGAIWLCRCDCGKSIDVKAAVLSVATRRRYKNTSCGCLKGNQCIEKKLAKDKGEKIYISNEPCINGHYERYSSTGTCLGCSKMNFDKNRDDRLKKLKKWGKENPDKLSAAHRRWREENKDKERNSNKKRRSTAEGRRGKAIHQRARKARLRAGGSGFVASEIENLLIDQKNICIYCSSNLEKFHIDHIMPVSRGGLNERSNIQLLCPPCNLRKANKTDAEFREFLER